MNAVKHILKRKLMQQKMLESKYVSKQSVSKYILRQRKIPDFVYEVWEKILDVPSEWFVDEFGYCRLLKPDEVVDLDEYLDKTEKDLGDEDLPGMETWRQMVDNAAWLRNIKYRVRKIHNLLEELVYHLPEEVTDIESAYCQYESNLRYFDQLFKIKRSGRIRDDDWISIQNALIVMVESDSDITRLEGDELACELYEVMKKHRDMNMQKDAEDLKLYVELWGPEILEINEEGEQ